MKGIFARQGARTKPRRQATPAVPAATASWRAFLRLGKLRRDFGRIFGHASRGPVAGLPEADAFGTRLFDSLVNAVAALGVIRLNGDPVLYTGFIVIPQLDRL
jgi:hypothetical protein